MTGAAPRRGARLEAIETARLDLRPARTEDDTALLAIFRDPFVYRYLFDGSAPDEALGLDILAAHRAHETERGLPFCALRRRGDARVIGFCGLKPDEASGEVEILYGLVPDATGEGLATEAARACLRYGFESLELPLLVAGVDEPNEASLAVLSRLGFRPWRETPGAFGRILWWSLERAEHRSEGAAYVVRTVAPPG